MAYGFYATITIDHTKVPSNQSNAPIVISGTYAGASGAPDLRTTGNSGNIENTVATGGASGALTVPADFDICTDKDNPGTTGLDFEFEKYSATTGEVVIHVEVDSLSSSANTVIYIVYGDSGVTTSQENVTGTWGNDYAGVWHLGEGGGTAYDSANANDASDHASATGTTGYIGDGQEFDGSNDYYEAPDDNSLDITGSITIQVAARPDVNNAEGMAFISKRIGSNINYVLRASYKAGTGFSGADRILFGYSDTDSTHHNYESNSALISTGSYQLFTASFTFGTGSSIALYKDGTSQAGTWKTGNGNGNVSGNTAGLVLGAGTSDATKHSWYNGHLDEVRISSVARTADWITVQYNTQSDPSSFYTMGSEQTFVTTVDVNLSFEIEKSFSGVSVANATNECAFTTSWTVVPTSLGNAVSTILFTQDTNLSLAGQGVALSDLSLSKKLDLLRIGQAVGNSGIILEGEQGLDLSSLTEALSTLTLINKSDIQTGATRDALVALSLAKQLGHQALSGAETYGVITLDSEGDLVLVSTANADAQTSLGVNKGISISALSNILVALSLAQKSQIDLDGRAVTISDIVLDTKHRVVLRGIASALSSLLENIEGSFVSDATKDTLAALSLVKKAQMSLAEGATTGSDISLETRYQAELSGLASALSDLAMGLYGELTVSAVEAILVALSLAQELGSQVDSDAQAHSVVILDEEKGATLVNIADASSLIALGAEQTISADALSRILAALSLTRKAQLSLSGESVASSSLTLDVEHQVTLSGVASSLSDLAIALEKTFTTDATTDIITEMALLLSVDTDVELVADASASSLIGLDINEGVVYDPNAIADALAELGIRDEIDYNSNAIAGAITELDIGAGVDYYSNAVASALLSVLESRGLSVSGIAASGSSLALALEKDLDHAGSAIGQAQVSLSKFDEVALSGVSVAAVTITLARMDEHGATAKASTESDLSLDIENALDLLGQALASAGLSWEITGIIQLESDTFIFVLQPSINRTYFVAPESRLSLVGKETRAFIVDKEKRIVEVD